MILTDGGGLMCSYFALCTNPADYLIAHPALGHVPTCKRCADKMEISEDARIPLEPTGESQS